MKNILLITACIFSASLPVFAEEDFVAPPSIFTPSQTGLEFPVDWLLQDVAVEESATTFLESMVEEIEPIKRVLLPEKNFQTSIKIVNKRSNQNKKITLQPEISYTYDELLLLSSYCIENYGNVYQNDVAFIDVETKGGDVLFSGWIYRKFPSVSGLEHAVYALSLTGCRTSEKILSVPENQN